MLPGPGHPPSNGATPLPGGPPNSQALSGLPPNLLALLQNAQAAQHPGSSGPSHAQGMPPPPSSMGGGPPGPGGYGMPPPGGGPGGPPGPMSYPPPPNGNAGAPPGDYGQLMSYLVSLSLHIYWRLSVSDGC